jgi:hypothetical protein
MNLFNEICIVMFVALCGALVGTIFITAIICCFVTYPDSSCVVASIIIVSLLVRGGYLLAKEHIDFS